MADSPLLSPQRERQLVQRLQQGDRAALGELLGAYQKRVYHVCLRMVGNRDDAAELTQDALLRAVQHAEGFKGNSRFSTWLLRIAMNLAVSHLRRRRVRSAASLDSADGRGSGGEGGGEGDGNGRGVPLKSMIQDDGELSGPESVEMGEQLDRLQRALASVDPDLRGVILLRDIQEMDYRQIAEVLSVPVGTVKSRLFRGRLALRRALEGKPGEASEVSDG